MMVIMVIILFIVHHTAKKCLEDIYDKQEYNRIKDHNTVITLPGPEDVSGWLVDQGLVCWACGDNRLQHSVSP